MKNLLIALLLLTVLSLVGCLTPAMTSTAEPATPAIEQLNPGEITIEQRISILEAKAGELEQTVTTMQATIDDYETRINALEQFTLEPPTWPREPIPTLRDKVEWQPPSPKYPPIGPPPEGPPTRPPPSGP